MVSMDYGYMTSEDQGSDENTYMPILVVVDRNMGKINANVAPSKGVNPYVVKSCGQNLKLLGYHKLMLKCDQEASMVALRNIDVVPEENPVEESQADG